MKKIEYGTEFLDHLKDSIHDLSDDNKELRKEIERLNNIINKAIEYIEQHRIGNEYSYEYDLFQRNARTSDLLNILKGVDKE